MSSPTPLSTLTQRTLFTAAAVLTASCGLYLMSYAYFAAKELLIGSRSDVLPEHKERVLILGASSGIGKELALQYAARGASVCLVARRQPELNAVADQCRAIQAGLPSPSPANKILSIVASISDVDRMLHIRDDVTKHFGGLDTLIIVAGVLTTRPLISVAGSTILPIPRSVRSSSSDKPSPSSSSPTPNPLATSIASSISKEGLQAALTAAERSIQTNYLAPLLAYTLFLPLLSTSSPSPSILLLSTVAALLPAPTRSLYAASKSASLALHHSLAMESDLQGLAVRFVACLPGSVGGTGLRTSAVDSLSPSTTFPAAAVPSPPSASSSSSTASPSTSPTGFEKLTLTPSHVATSCISALSSGSRSHETLWLPRTYRWAWLMSALPGSVLKGVVERGAKKKYKDGMGA